MALLNFKMGLQANLTQNSPTIAPGTIYVTTDERAMYIDVPEKGSVAAHRIRLGDFRIYETFDALKKDKTDWSQSCLYYVADKKALARYNGTTWELINDTSSLSSAIASLQTVLNGTGEADGLITRVTNLETAVNTTIPNNYEKKADATKKLAEAKTYAKEYTDDEIEKLTGTTGQVGLNKKAIEDLSSAMTVVNDKLEGIPQVTPENGTPTNEGAVKAYIDNKVGKVAGDLSTVSKDLDDLEKLVGTAADGKTVNTAFGKIAKNADAIAALENLISGTGDGSVDKKIDGKIKTAIEALDSTVTSTNHENLAIAITQVDGKLTGASITGNFDNKYDAKNTAQGLINNLTSASGQVGKNTAAISDLSTEIGDDETANSVKGRITALETKVDVEKVSTAIATAKSEAEATAKGYADAAEANAKAEVTKLANGQVNTNKTSIQNLANLVGNINDDSSKATVFGYIDAESDRIDAILNDKVEGNGLVLDSFADVRTFVTSSIAANDAMVFKGVVTLTSVLPVSGMENGDTYKVGETGAYTIKANTTENAKVGDLFIYDGTAKEWRLVPSGGEDYEDPSLSAAENKIILTSAVTDKQIGSVEIVGANDCLSVSTANNKITLTLEWGTF